MRVEQGKLEIFASKVGIEQDPIFLNMTISYPVHINHSMIKIFSRKFLS